MISLLRFIPIAVVLSACAQSTQGFRYQEYQSSPQQQVLCTQRDGLAAYLNQPAGTQTPAAAFGCYPIAPNARIDVVEAYPPLPTGRRIARVEIDGAIAGYAAVGDVAQIQPVVPAAIRQPATAAAPILPARSAPMLPPPSQAPQTRVVAMPSESVPRTPAASVPVQPSAPKKQDAALQVSDAQISARLVRESRAEYYATGHPCACPDDLARNGSRCGARSAYTRPGGAAPYCYVSDVPASAVEAYRSSHM